MESPRKFVPNSSVDGTNEPRILQMQVQVETQFPVVALQSRVESGHLQVLGVSPDEINDMINQDGARIETMLKGTSDMKNYGNASDKDKKWFPISSPP